jgi:hypothetical protein
MAKQDIIVSPAKLWVAPVGEALPDETTVAAGAVWGGNWTSLGYTLEPVAINFEVETFDLTVEQEITPVRTLRTLLNAGFTTTLAELTGANLAMVMDATKTTTAAGASQKGYDLIEVNAEKADVSLYTFGVEGVRVSDTNARLPVRIFFPRASITSNGELTFAKGAGAGLPVVVRAFAGNDSKAVIIHNVTAPATA